MQRWAGRVAVVTGASSGIGAAISQELVKKGLKVVGLARRVERVEEMSKTLSSQPGKLYPVKADITKDTDVKDAFKWIKSNLGGVDILINNAGVNIGNSLTVNGPLEGWRSMFDLNVLALSNCTKEAVQSMKDRGVDDGHIVHINSIYPCTTKHAVTMLAEGLRRELVSQKSKITSHLNVVDGKALSTPSDAQQTLHESHPHLQPQDLADAVLYVLGTPPHVQVHELTLRPTV
ncbi:hypothetical protein L9F63_004100, partial [Diploptera punctata]